MASKRKDLVADSLTRVTNAARENIVRSTDITRTDRQRLADAGYLHGIMKGWYLLTTPEADEGESTAWFASYWAFTGCYLKDRFDDAYCLGAETSMELHLGSTTIPRQVSVITRRGGQSVLDLPHGVSLLTYQDPDNLPDPDDVEWHHETVRAMSLPLALARIAPSFFERRPRDADIALRLVHSAADLARILVKGGYQAAAERIVGAYRHLDIPAMADEIVDEMKAAGFRLAPVNPFESNYGSTLSGLRITSPHTARLRAMWMDMRDTVLLTFPEAPGLPSAPGEYLRKVEEQYDSDAYNSLSIEGYRVTPTLIEQMRSGGGAPDTENGDPVSAGTMAAKGYLRAFKLVETSIRRILAGESPGLTVAEYLHVWYRALFSPNVTAGLLRDHDLIGYRRQPVYIKGSLHVPPPGAAVPDCMAAFLDLLHKEEAAAVRAVMGHFMFVFIHPYMDGNGRLARFLMNTMLASGGYPWTVIPIGRRREYMQALETASVDAKIGPFADFLASVTPDYP